MRVLHVSLVVGLGVVLSLPLAADGFGLGMAEPGNPHNFTDNITSEGAPVAEIGAGGWNARAEICRTCHVPHDHNLATKYGAAGLLWNHALSEATYQMYSSPSLDNAIASEPTGMGSRMCLGCHDGTVGIDTYDKYTGGAVFIADYDDGYQTPGSNYVIGSTLDLSATHPISVEYDPTVDPGLHPKTNPMGASGTIEDVLEGGLTVECSTCHDVHDQPGESVPGTHLLRVTTKQPEPSALCLTCHIK